jgi:hypothetical protein
MDIDYSYSQTQAVNQQQILTGSATRFAVPESNYTMLRSVNPRYNGSRTTSPNFNQPIYKDLITLNTESQEPNASRYSNWFVYFDYIESSFPEVPGGGNIHCTYLINTEGQAIPLTGDNKYVQDVSNIFTPGLKANILPAVYADKQTPQITIFDGGTKYQTIIEKSGSGDISTAQFSITTDISSINFSSLFLTTSSLSTTSSVLLDNGSRFLDSLLDTNSVWNGSSYETVRFYSNNSICKIFNKSQNQFNTDFVSPSDTYLPIQPNDFIRIGNSTGTTPITTLDSLFNNTKLYNVSNISTINRIINPTNTSSLGIIPSTFGINVTNINQTFRIFRRLEDETFVVSTSLPPYTDPGLLIPENFNPNFNPYELAKKAGVIS